MKKIMTLALALSVATGAGMLSSCSNDDYKYDPEYEQKVKESEYAANFLKLIGNYRNVDSWDFSDDEAQLATRAAGEEITITQVAAMDFGIKNTVSYTGKITSTITKNNALYDNIKKLLPDGGKPEGKEAVLVAPSNSFTIYPIMAQGAYTYDLYVKVGDKEAVKVFTKDWNVFDKPYCNGMGLEGTYSKGVTKSVSMPGVTIEAPIGTPIQIYINNIKNGKTLVDSKNPNIGTGSGNAIVVNAEARPEGLSKDIMPDDAIIKYVGIEDAPNMGDKDFNDLVLAIVGNPYTPEPIVIEEDEYTAEIARPAKRYMIEDLGGTDDFDFNDIVVDVEDIITGTYHIKKVNGVITENELVKEGHKQQAIVRALGGDLDITIQIGKTTWNKKANNFNGIINTGKLNADGSLDPSVEPDYAAKLAVINLNDDDWNPLTDNVVAIVRNKTNDGVYNIAFPEPGTAPLMIATKTSQKWMKERVRIDWLSDKIK